MNELANYIGEYMARLGLDPSLWANYARAMERFGRGEPLMRIPSAYSDYWHRMDEREPKQFRYRDPEKPNNPPRRSPRVPMEPGIPPGPIEGRAWGIHKQILNPSVGSSDADIEFLKRARLHQALAPRGLREALGGK